MKKPTLSERVTLLEEAVNNHLTTRIKRTERLQYIILGAIVAAAIANMFT